MFRSVSKIPLVAILALGGLTVLPASAQYLPQPEVAEPGEMLPNNGFDAADVLMHPLNWAVSGNATVVYRAADRTAGPGSLQVVNTAGSAVTVMGRREIATPGVEYTLTGKAKVTSGVGASVILRFYDFNKALVGEKTVVPTSSTFDTFTLKATAPAGADLLTVILAGSTATAGTTFFDELSLTQSAPAYDPKLGSERELFLDDYRIESAHDVGRVVHSGKTLSQPVIRAEKPWEKSAYTYGSSFLINGTYRLWYTCYNEVEPNYHLCYAESKDGVRWTKPNLGVYEWKGSTANNIVQASSGSVAYNPDAPEHMRFTQLYFKGGVVNQTMGYYGRTSPDGIHWTEVNPDKPLLLDGDVATLTYDQRTGRYIAAIKKRMFTADTSGYDRSAFVATSTDFLNWTRPQLGVMGDAADDGGAIARGGLESQIYGMPILPYESIYIGVPWVFDILNFTAGEYKTAADGPVTPQLAASRDLLRWDRPTRGALLEPGLPGAWDDGALYTAHNVITTRDTVTMYYAGFNNGHGGAESTNPDRDNHIGQTGMATWRRDGFLSLTNGATPGTGDAGQVITKPLVFDGSELRMNLTVRQRGSVVVTVLDAEGTPIPGFVSKPLTGDKLDAKVNFGSKKFQELAGQQVKLQFDVYNADLYSYWVD